MRSPTVRLALLPVCMLGACAPSASQGGLRSDDPMTRLRAIETAARDEDRSAVGELVRSLDSSDPLERMLAIDALRRITGETFDYRYEDDRAAREPAVARWAAYARADRQGGDGSR